MQKFFLVLYFFLIQASLFSQSNDIEGKMKAQEDALRKKGSQKKEDTLSSKYYKVFYMDGREETVDTSLSIYKDYKFNFLRQDSFELLKMPNVGHTYNMLGYNLKHRLDFPEFGALGKHFHYFEIDDIGYYNVPTPFTELYAKSTFEQGQVLDALVSINLSPQFNLTLAHKGFKSLGKYVNTRTRGNQFRFSSNYISKNKKSRLNFHLTSQNFFNQENGGLTSDGIYFFEQATNYFIVDDFGNQIVNEDGTFEMIEYDGYLDRSRLPSWLLSESSLYSKRVFLDFSKSLLKKKETNFTNLFFGAQFIHEYKKLQYSDPYTSGLFGEVHEGLIVSDLSRYSVEKSSIYIKSDLNKLGQVKINYSLINSKNIHSDYDQSLNGLIFELKNNQSNISANWNKNFQLFEVKVNYNKSLNGGLSSNFSEISLKINSIKNIKFDLNAISSERSPNLNFILFRSAYKDYNWYNPDLKKIKTLSLFANISYKELIKISAEYNTLNNYTFFRELTSPLTTEMDNFRRVRPNQIDSQINYSKVKLFSKVDFGKFSLINTVQYQKKEQEVLIDGLATLNVPEWLSRNTIMISSEVFNNSLFIQSGITFNYFTKFYADYYNPLISEFVTQNYKEIGEFPRLDFFFNAKIQQTRVFIKVEHLNSSFTGYDYYSDPFNPYRDLSVRFGLVWNFFQ